MIPRDLIPHLHEVNEQIIRLASESEGEGNNFKKMLFFGEIYRKAGLEPIYMVTTDCSHYFVTCKDTLGKRLH